MAYVAAGRFDGYWERRIKAWDVAAGILLVKEAGGFVEALEPGQSAVDSGAIICANAQLFDGFAKTIRQG